MSKTLIIGSTGKIGSILLNEFYQSISPVVAMVRDSTKADFPESVEVVEGDLEKDISAAMVGCSTVIFTAGSGAGTGLDKTLLVDLWGARKAIDAAKENGVEHFIMVSSRGADNPDNGPERIKPYSVAKHFADEYLMQSGLNYTILRPGRLIDESGTGLIKTIRPIDPDEQFISRNDTAKVIVHCLNNSAVINKVFELFEGQDSIESVIL